MNAQNVFWTLLLFVLSITVVRFIVPELLNAPSNEAAVIGALILLIWVALVYLYVTGRLSKPKDVPTQAEKEATND